jgi:PHP family Zn ribbon phosphoesterase
MDMTGYNKPYGVALAAAGALFVRKSLTKKYKPDPEVTLICPKCDEAFELTESSEKRCPKCGTDLELLKGFYERHPERKENGEPQRQERDM